MRAVDNPACLKPACENFGKPGSNIVGHGWITTKSGRRPRHRCKICGGTVSLNTGTPYRGLRCGRREFDQVASLRVEGVSIFCDGPDHGSFPQHGCPMARPGLERGRAFQPAHLAELRGA